ncbi:DUF4190 domain-containing protein [Subtercola endophyticus]|uniref:DUF4190 domain-containing protein n=1 Tax=Subtercola endophyticus TaxID=2895559 RepID=UPI001E37A294|nr:DUF4190 domain-containing protein [Subtercola endophyticus]UFS58594.1 DUF4190 domain-containing protein [Subtercola endophyticus]
MTESSAAAPGCTPELPPPPPFDPALARNVHNPYLPTTHPPMNVLAIVSLVCSFVLPVCAVIVGHIALRRIRRTGSRGYSFAVAGTFIGYVGVALGILIAVLLFVAGLTSSPAVAASSIFTG